MTHRAKQQARREVAAVKVTQEAISLEMASIVTALRDLPPVDGATYPPRDRYALTGIDKMELEQMGINPWA